MTTPAFELTAIDRHFAEFITREAENVPPCLAMVVSLASHAVGEGNICLNLADISGTDILVDGMEHRVSGLPELMAQLAGTGVVGVAGDYRPLILDGEGRLYLYRYWKYESDLARVIRGKAEGMENAPDEVLLGAGLQRLFPGIPDGEIDWQKIAALAAVQKRFCVISGGPGTGKTSTVVKILALLLEQEQERPLRIALAAPTGKAAARLKESIRHMKDTLDCSGAVTGMIPENVTTIHRLLGVRSGSVRFRHSDKNLLPHDVVIIDEASMVALPLMAKLAVSLKRDARLILLGDRDQLASVEAGAVLGDICGGDRPTLCSPGFADFVKRASGERIPAASADAAGAYLSDSLVVLQRNYRFGDGSSIGAVSRCINAGEGKNALAVLTDVSRTGSRWQTVPAPDKLKKALAEKVAAEYRPYLAAGSPREALKLFDRFRILSAVRQGPYGVSGLNALVEEILAEKGLIEQPARWYAGRPVMVTVNDYGLNLFNGDIGIALPDPDHNGQLRVWFPGPEGGVRSVAPVRLPEHESVYAMTVHKSQGSEFDQVLLLLPNNDSEALTRELIYTGITRAKTGVEVWANEEVFGAAVSRRVNRKSGLDAALWQSEKR
jgi:exodeoxyribonuclease V alpha subunit